MRISKITPRDNYVLYVVSKNGEVGEFDVRPYLNSEVFSLLKDEKEFKKIHNGEYFIEWECGEDLSADTIEAHWKQSRSELTDQVA